MTLDRDGGGGEGYEQPRNEGPPPAKQRRRFFRSEMVWNGAELQMEIRSNEVSGVGLVLGRTAPRLLLVLMLVLVRKSRMKGSAGAKWG